MHPSQNIYYFEEQGIVIVPENFYKKLQYIKSTYALPLSLTLSSLCQKVPRFKYKIPIRKKKKKLEQPWTDSLIPIVQRFFTNI